MSHGPNPSRSEDSLTPGRIPPLRVNAGIGKLCNAPIVDLGASRPSRLPLTVQVGGPGIEALPHGWATPSSQRQNSFSRCLMPRLAEPDTRSAPVRVDELDAGGSGGRRIWETIGTPQPAIQRARSSGRAVRGVLHGFLRLPPCHRRGRECGRPCGRWKSGGRSELRFCLHSVP
jgi:hypothetical protein